MQSSRMKMAMMASVMASAIMSNPNHMRAPISSANEGRIYTKSRSNGRRNKVKTGRKYTHAKTGRSFKGHFVKGNRQVINHRP